MADTNVLCPLGLPLDSADDPWVLYDVAVAVALSFALVSVVAAVVALDQILAVARADQQKLKSAVAKRIEDPGP